MIILALDLSTNSGYAIFQDKKIIKYGNIKHKVEGDYNSPSYPVNYLLMAQKIVYDVYELILTHGVDVLAIEETNKGRDRYSQKQLEFIHCQIADMILTNKLKAKYISVSDWRSSLKINLSKDDRKVNSDINKQRKEKYLELHAIQMEKLNPLMEKELEGIKLKRERNKIIKKYEKEIETNIKDIMKRLRLKADGSSKINSKKVAIRYVNSEYGYEFKNKDNDIAEAICIGECYIKKYSNIKAEE